MTPPTDRLGRPLHDLRISVTDRCNFRCPYCMPAEIYGERYEFMPKPKLLTFEEIDLTHEHDASVREHRHRPGGQDHLLGGDPALADHGQREVRGIARGEVLEERPLGGIEVVAILTGKDRKPWLPTQIGRAHV